MDFSYYKKAKTYKYLLLIKNPDLNEIELNLLDSFKTDKDDWLIGELAYDTLNKRLAEKYLEKLFQFIEQFKIQTVVLSDAQITKAVLNQTATSLLGVVSTIKDLSTNFVVVPSYRQAFFRNDVEKQFQLGVKTFLRAKDGLPGLLDSTHNYEYTAITEDNSSIIRLHKFFDYLSKQKRLTMDIEGYSLSFTKAKIATISFAVSTEKAFGIQGHYKSSKSWYIEFCKLLRHFFENYKGELILHNANYDFKAIIYELWHERNLFNPTSNVDGLCTFGNITVWDTFLLAYVNLNSVTKPGRGLKELAFEYMGNYGLDMKDITQHSLEDLLKYNADDTVATFLYFEEVMKDLLEQYDGELPDVIAVQHNAILPTIQSEMMGFKVNKKKAKKAKKSIVSARQKLTDTMDRLDAVKELRAQMRQDILENRQQRSLTRVFNLDNIPLSPFNPQSGSQLAMLLFNILKLPVLKQTKKKAPATTTKVIQQLLDREETKKLGKD